MSHYRQQPDLSGLNLEDLSKLEQDLQTRKRALEQAKIRTPRKLGQLSDERLNKLIEAHLAIEAEEAAKVGALGFMARALTMATMPHSKPEISEFQRRNGAFVLSMHAPSHVGLPYGSKPRLLIAFLTTEAVKSKNRDIVLGDSLSDFMRELGLMPTGGRWGSITSLKQQMTRLFSSTVSCVWETKDSTAIANMPIVSKAQLWWDPKRPEQAALWQSVVRLGEDFFNEVTQHPVPIDLRAVRAIKQSPMALDIYFWLTHRLSYLRTTSRTIPWAALQMQFGSDYPNTSQGVRDFKKQFIAQLKKVHVVYPQARLTALPDGVVLMSSLPHIKKSG
jgi:hypothetical protein